MMENGFPLLKIRSADVFWLATILLFMIDSPISMLELMELLGKNCQNHAHFGLYFTEFKIAYFLTFQDNSK